MRGYPLRHMGLGRMPRCVNGGGPVEPAAPRGQFEPGGSSSAETGQAHTHTRAPVSLELRALSRVEIPPKICRCSSRAGRTAWAVRAQQPNEEALLCQDQSSALDVHGRRITHVTVRDYDHAYCPSHRKVISNETRSDCINTPFALNAPTLCF
jgi:hypothetical protein